jgi:hypothetical protein
VKKKLKSTGDSTSYEPGTVTVNGNENRNRQKRLERRNAGMERLRKEKEREAKNEKHEMELKAAVKTRLHEDKKKGKRGTKRPGPEKFTGLFTFMMSEGQRTACQDWRAHSFNESKQYFEFIRGCIFPYAVPEPLVLASILPDYTFDGKGGRYKSPDYAMIALSRRWLRDIASGDSFYKRNKEYFTRPEAHYFLSSIITYHDPSSVIELYFHAKCKARNFSKPLSFIITRLFSNKFGKYLNCTLITEFLDFIARTMDYPYTYNEMGDLCDFILSKITRYDHPFTFSGRTAASLIGLANEWHFDQLRRIEITRQNKAWKGIPVSDFLYETGEGFWEIKQLFTAQDLFNEGQKMKHCVASYASSCASGSCGIFNVSCIDKISEKAASLATVEISRNKRLVQARAKCNKNVEKGAMKVIKLWIVKNYIKT